MEATSGMYLGLRKIINAVDELRDIGLHQYIQLPRIAVLGSQSSGKSSLLEMIVGIDFLPRGEGVVTRRPLELRLVHTHGLKTPFAEFDRLPGERYTDFDKVREKINELTEKVAGKNKGIIDDPIILSVHAESCPDLTLIDLPGITRIPLEGTDQKQDIERVTKEMALKYIKDPRTIILCVIPANADISTSDSLQMAIAIDPAGTRTLGVITKIDIMDKGTNAKRMLYGQDIPLKLGYVGVKGRSQLDINNKVPVKNGLETEKNFFASHPVYSTLQPNSVGTDALVQKLMKIFYHHIKTIMPDIYQEVITKITESEQRLKELGTPLPANETEKLYFLWQVVSKFCESFKTQLTGRYDLKAPPDTKDDSSAVTIRHMFNELFTEFMDKKFHATMSYSDEDIERAVILHEGDNIAGFPSIDAFLHLLEPQLERLKDPALDLLNNTYSYLEEIATGIINTNLQRFPKLTGEFIDMVVRYLDKERQFTKILVENLIDAEIGYLFTNDSEYLKPRLTVMTKEHSAPEPKKLFIDELRHKIDIYFAIVCRNVRDSIPKIIGHFLVRSTQDNLQLQMYGELNKNHRLLELLNESPEVRKERESLKATLSILHKAANMLRKDSELADAFVKKTSGDDMEEGDSSSRSQESQRSTPRSSRSTADQLKLRKENSQTLFETIKQQHQQQQTKANLPYHEDLVFTPSKKQQAHSHQSSNISTPTSVNNPFKQSQKESNLMDKSGGTPRNEEATILASKPLEKPKPQPNSLFGPFLSKRG